MSTQEKNIKNKININKIKASKLKEIGFKSKYIAKKFAQLNNIEPKEYNSDEEFLKQLKRQLNKLKK